MSGMGAAALDFIGGVGSLIGNARQAAKNRAFQENMFKHRYQWQMQDMEAAGLNPMLAFGQSPPGPSSGATASFNNPASSALAARRLKTELKNLDEQRELTKTQREGVEIDNKIKAASVPFKEAEEAIKSTIVEKAKEAAATAKSWWQRWNLFGPDEPEEKTPKKDEEDDAAWAEPMRDTSRIYYPRTYEQAQDMREQRKEWEANGRKGPFKWDPYRKKESKP